MTSHYLHTPARGRRRPRWRRLLLVLIGVVALFLAPALAHSQICSKPLHVAGGEPAAARLVRVP